MNPEGLILTPIAQQNVDKNVREIPAFELIYQAERLNKYHLTIVEDY